MNEHEKIINSPMWTGLKNVLLSGNNSEELKGLSSIGSTHAMEIVKAQEAIQRKHEIEKAIAGINRMALTGPYTGPPHSSGDMYMGWPLEELLKIVPAHLVVAVRSEIKYRYGARPMPSPQASNSIPSRVYTYQEKMEMRMGWQPGKHKPFVFVEYRGVLDKAFMWILTSDAQSVVLEDDHALFPSDKLITQVRLLGGQ